MENLETQYSETAVAEVNAAEEKPIINNALPDAETLEKDLAVILDMESEDFSFRLMTCGSYAAGMMGGIFGGLIGLNFRHEWLGMGLGCLGAILFFLVFRASGLRLSSH